MIAIKRAGRVWRRRIRLALLAGLVALPLSGCQRLCDAGVITWCERSEGDALNDPPGFLPLRIDNRTPARIVPVEFGQTLTFSGTADDPDSTDVIDPETGRRRFNDALLYEWDLDGDGDFERTGQVASRAFTRANSPRSGRLTVALRVSDFPLDLGAPGEATRTQALAIIEPGTNRPPTAQPNPVRVGEPVALDASASSDPDFDDHDALTFLLTTKPADSFGIVSDSATASFIPQAPGRIKLAVEVRDQLQSVGTRNQNLEVLPASAGGNAAPTASFTVTPNPAAVTREIVLDASGSSDAEGPIVRYDRDLNGDGEFEALGGAGPRRVVAFAAPGERPVGLRVLDAQGASATTTRTVVAGANGRPTARFTAAPNPARIGQEIGLNASRSSDPEGAIARYEWYLDGNGSFETNNGGEPTRTVSYSTEGDRLVGLRVTDADGSTNTATETVSVVGNALRASLAGGLVVSSAFPAGAARAPGHAARARAGSLPFTARLTGRPLPGRRGKLRRPGPRVSLGGVRAGGRLRTRLMLDRFARAVPGRRAFERLLTARWRARINLRLNRRTKRLSATATARPRPRLGRGLAACLRFRVGVHPGVRPTARFTLLGGTGAAARLRASGSGLLRLERDGSATILGRLRTRNGATRSLPRTCQALASRGRR